MHQIIKKKKFFQNRVYKAFSNNIVKNNIITKKFLTLEVLHKYKDIGGVSCLIINHENKIGLMNVYNPIIKKKYYSVVQGFCGKKETPSQSIKREIKEEIGASINIKDLKHLCNFYPILSLIDTKMKSYFLKINKKIVFNKNFIEDEIGIDQLIFYKKKKVKELMKNPSKFDIVSYLLLSYYFFLK